MYQRPAFTPPLNLPAAITARMAQKAAESWCYVAPSGGSFFVSEDKARAMQDRNGGLIFPPIL